MAKNNEFITIGLERLEPNEGQLEGLPSNPRQITESKMALLKQNIKQYPEMLKLRSLMVYPLENDKYIIIGGNMRYRAMSELGMKDAPCVVIPKETDIETLKAYTIIDNNGFGKYDWDMLANEWDEFELEEWGVDLPVMQANDDSDLDLETGVTVENSKQASGFKFKKYYIMLTPQEEQQFEERIKLYVNTFGNTVGFINDILNGNG